MNDDTDKQKPWVPLVKAVAQGVGAGILLGAAFAGGYLYHDLIANPPSPEVSLELVREADDLLNQYFLYPIPDETTRVYGAIRGLVTSLEDPYTTFSEPQAAEVNNTNLAGRFGGIGAELTRDEQGHFVIARVYRDNPAYEAGVMAGDIITAVDGVEVDITAADMNAVLAAVRGEVGEPVVLTLLRGEETLEVEIIRAEVLVPSVFWRILEEDERVGYIQIVHFTDRTTEELVQALEELSEQGAEAYILDLRNNTGGLVSSAVGVAGEFLNGGVVLYEQTQGGQEDVMNASRGGSALDAPLVVLVNAQTASAAEIVAGAFQDRARATLIGQPTFGKGSVQLILALSDGSSIRVTNAQWFTPDHHRIEGQGLTPDIPIEAVEGIDAELAAALEHLDAKLTVALGGD